jgi:tetratricopeptide (TPR) repeat protein
MSPRSFSAAALLVFLLAGFYAWCVTRAYRAYRLSETRDLPSLQRAIQLEPSDASNYDLLGRYFIWTAQDPRAAATQFRKAVSLNPYASTYWLHLAQAESSLGNDREQADAIRNAIAVDPTTPAVAWEAANWLLVQGRPEEALDQLAVVIRSDPKMADAALETSWRSLEDVDRIRRLLPPDPEAYLRFVKILVARKQWAPAEQVWSSMFQLNRQVDPRSALFYVDVLLAERNVTAARRAWLQLSQTASALNEYNSPGNAVTNGNFDHDILNGGFDWHYSAVPGVGVVLDSTQAHLGNESLLITFSGSSNDAGIWQWVPVTPGTSYIASAWVRSEELQSADGPYLAIYDGYKNIEYAKSESTLGTTPWHRVETTFVAPPEVNLVIVRFSRRTGGSHIQGQFWVDDVQLSEAAGRTSHKQPLFIEPKDIKIAR